MPRPFPASLPTCLIVQSNTHPVAVRSGSPAHANNTVEVRVADTGVGIPPEDLARIWERLFRGDRSRSERGLGLGLSFVRAIVHAHGGTVAAESPPDGGTTVTVTLPSA